MYCFSDMICANLMFLNHYEQAKPLLGCSFHYPQKSNLRSMPTIYLRCCGVIGQPKLFIFAYHSYYLIRSRGKQYCANEQINYILQNTSNVALSCVLRCFAQLMMQVVNRRQHIHPKWGQTVLYTLSIKDQTALTTGFCPVQAQ